MFAGKTVFPDMLITARTVDIFTMNFASPDELDTAGLETLFLFEYMIRGNLEIEFAMKRMPADKQTLLFEQISYNFLHTLYNKLQKNIFNNKMFIRY